MTRLADLISIKHGYAFAGKYFTEAPTKKILLTPGNFRIGGGFKGDKHKYYDGPVPDGYTLEPGDLIVTMTDLSKSMDTLGYPALVPASLDGSRYLHNQRLGLVRSTSESVDQTWLYYRLCACDYRNEVMAGSTGTTVHHTSPARILAFDLMLPSLEEQREQAATLASLDAKIEGNRRVVSLAEDLLRAKYAAFPKRSLVRASTLLIPVLGGTPARSVADFWGGDIAWASAKDIASGNSWFVSETAEHVTSAGVRNSAAKVLPAGTIVMTARGTVGALARLGAEMTFNQSCYALTCRPGTHEGLLYLALLDAVSRIRNATHGTVFDTVNMSTFDQVLLDWPTVDDESKEDIDSLFALIEQRQREIAFLGRVRDALIRKFFAPETNRGAATLHGSGVTA